jgi:hypothetical protein
MKTIWEAKHNGKTMGVYTNGEGGQYGTKYTFRYGNERCQGQFKDDAMGDMLKDKQALRKQIMQFIRMQRTFNELMPKW